MSGGQRRSLLFRQQLQTGLMVLDYCFELLQTMISAAEISITFFLSVLVSLYFSNFKTTLMVLDLYLHFVCHLFYSSPQLLLSTQLRKIGNVPFKKECYIVAYFSTGGPGSSCEIIILRNESWRIYKSLNGIFTTALKNKKTQSISQ